MRKQYLWIIATACLVVVAMSGVPKANGAQEASRFKNIQVLNDLSDREIGQQMQSFAKQLGVKCVDCHVQGDFATDENEHKVEARKMIEIVNALNEMAFFKEGDKADCFLCHKGSLHIEPAP